MHHPWTETEAALLKSLREQALLTPAVFAKRHALSNGQLKELEQGGRGSFYSEDIKAFNGRKLLKALGYIAPIEPEPPASPPASPVAPPPAESLIHPNLPETAGSAEPLVAGSEPVSVAPDTPGNVDPLQAQTLPAQEDAPAKAPASTAPPTPRSTPTPTASPPPSGASTWALAGLGLVAAVGVFWVTSGSRSTAPSPARSSEPMAAPSPVALPASAPEGSSDPQPSAGPAAPGASSAATPLTQAAPAKWPAGCEPVAGTAATAYQSPVADRPDTYVHVESVQDVQVCLVDGQNRPTPLNLKTGQSYTVYGTAPFVVRSTQWQHLKIYFQGLRVQVESGQPTGQVILNPRRGA